MHRVPKNIGLLLLAVFVFTAASAQKKKKAAATKPVAAPVQQPVKPEPQDTSAPKMVTITSAFKPVLKSAAKINFVAATPVIDSSKIPVAYTIPSQNLFFSYQPVSLKPLALAVDSTVKWNNDQYVKLGAGNFSSFMGEAGFSFGDGQQSITNLRGSFITATGHAFAQQASKLNIDALSVFHTGESHEWTAHAFYKNSTQYYYGFTPLTGVTYLKDDLLQRFNTVGIELGVQNQLENAFGIKYHPQLSFIRFSDNRDGHENNLIVKLPFSKVFNKFYALDIGLNADIARASYPLGAASINTKNDLYSVHPAFLFTTPNVKLHLGIKPTWDNMAFSLLPELTIEAKLQEDLPFSVEAGWNGYFNKNTYRSLTEMNPWVSNGALNTKNTKVNEQYIGIKGNAGSHFTYNARLSYMHLNNQPLFLNDTYDGKTFNTVYESAMNAIRIHGEVGYTIGEQVSLLASANYTQYSSLSDNVKAWGLLPFQMTGTLRWKVLKDLQVKGDVYLWDGATYAAGGFGTAANARKADPVADINLGAEFTVLPKLNLWFQMNNMLNTAYERWHQYPTLGFMVMGGVVYSFR